MTSTRQLERWLFACAQVVTSHAVEVVNDLGVGKV